MNQEKYEDIAEKQIETDRFLAELIEAETVLGIGIVLAIVELQYRLNIHPGLVLYVLILLIGFFIWEMFRLEETEKELEEEIERERED
jgi:uncharacterized membrane protein YqgA involved in biofilm formation